MACKEEPVSVGPVSSDTVLAPDEPQIVVNRSADVLRAAVILTLVVGVMSAVAAVAILPQLTDIELDDVLRPGKSVARDLWKPKLQPT